MARGVGKSVNRTELAAIFGVSLPTIDLWVRNGCPGVKSGVGKGGGWTFDSAEVATWRMEQAAAEAGGDDAKDEQTIKRRRAAIGLKAEELDLARQLGLVAPIEDFERAQAKFFAVLRQSIMTVPARVAMALVGEKSEIRIKQVLSAELASALERAAAEELDLGDDEDDQDDE
ncbi:MAG TPA: terminase small subunit [Pyrinomonadaceae bacterium]|nr:terminase small subunit [Pyrinomonadaceae bacterium]